LYDYINIAIHLARCTGRSARQWIWVGVMQWTVNA